MDRPGKSRPAAFAINTSSRLIIGGVALLSGLIVARSQWAPGSVQVPDEVTVVPLRRTIEGAPKCPWRQPASDLRQFFGGQTHYQTRTVVLSDRLLELRERLGRLPTPEENPLHIYPVFNDQSTLALGTVLVRRVKAEYGAIEIVLAVDKNRRVAGIRLQRLREPKTIAKVLLSPRWLANFIGNTARDEAQIKKAAQVVPPIASTSAQAVAEGVRSLLILNEVAAGVSKSGNKTHHAPPA